ncbi:MAG: TonB family protein, partial [Candidatus Latescibacterota bacterium]
MGRRTRTGVFFASLVSAFAAAAVHAASPESYPTNVELVHLVARGAVAEALRGFELAGSGPLLLLEGVPSEADWLVESELIAALRREGISVRVGELRRAAAAPRPQSKEKKSGPLPAAEMSFPVDTPPKLIEGKPIPYPEQACAEGLEGEVTVRLILNEQGSVANVLVQKRPGEP